MESENIFRGRLDKDSITLNRGQQETITVTDLVIPQGTKIGMELLLSLVVRKDLNPAHCRIISKARTLALGATPQDCATLITAFNH